MGRWIAVPKDRLRGGLFAYCLGGMDGAEWIELDGGGRDIDGGGGW